MKSLTRYVVGIVTCVSITALAEAPYPARTFLADDHLSFPALASWTPALLGGTEGLLFRRALPEGGEAIIRLEFFDPGASVRLADDVGIDELKALAEKQSIASAARVLAQDARLLAGRNAFELTWEDRTEKPAQTQTVYYFAVDRFYALSLRAPKDSFPWLVPEFQTWLSRVALLSRRDKGTLSWPARGGLWRHRGAGATVAIPDDWLIAVASDMTLGAAIAEGERSLTLTLSVESQPPPQNGFSASEQRQMRRDLEERGRRLVGELEEPFHGYPAFQIDYQTVIQGKLRRGADLWILSPRARWLISLEGDAKLFRERQKDFRAILDAIQFD